MLGGFTSPYDSCHGHDCMIVGFTPTYGSCHGHDCMIVGFTSTTIMTMTATIGIEVNPTFIQS
jgi:hypothetical protein